MLEKRKSKIEDDLKEAEEKNQESEKLLQKNKEILADAEVSADEIIRVGHKIESIKSCDKVCFTVYGNECIKDEEWAPYVSSTVVFGRCHLIEDQEYAIKLVKRLAMKYYPDEKIADEEIEKYGQAVQMFAIDIEHMSGKEIKEK